jgi:menaquinone-dependent protoporphyrinogen oxidase
MKILIVYGTSEGHTRKIARFMETVLHEAGHEVSCLDASDSPPPPVDFDAVIIGASIHVHKYQSAVTHYITAHREALNKLPSAFFSVCLAVASDHEEEHREAEKISADFLRQCGWAPTAHTQIAGALKYTEYDFFKRWIMRRISEKEGRTTDTSKDHEFTDWAAVRSFVLTFAGPVNMKQ